MRGCVRSLPFPWPENLFEAGRQALAALGHLQRLNRLFEKGAVSLREYRRGLKTWAVTGRVPRRPRGMRRHQRRVKAGMRRRVS